MIGQNIDLTYDHENLGDSPATLSRLISGKHAFSERLSKAKRPMIVLNGAVMSRPDASALQTLTLLLAKKLKARCEDPTWKVFNVLQRVRQASFVASPYSLLVCIHWL